jgi:hypothetical protein
MALFQKISFQLQRSQRKNKRVVAVARAYTVFHLREVCVLRLERR